MMNLRRLWNWLRGPRPIFDCAGKTPARSTAGAAGYDLYSFEECEIPPKEFRLVRTGLVTSFSPFWVALIFDRSGYAARGLHRFAGVIDCDFRGEWKVILYNTTDKTVFVRLNDRIAQFLFLPIWWGKRTTGELSSTSRGEGCCSSTGR